MAEKQCTNLQPAASMSEKLLQSKAPQKVIIIKSSPAIGPHGVKRKLECSSGNPEKVQKPSETVSTPCSAFSAAETRGKNIIVYNRGSKPLICTMPKASSVPQNRTPVTVVAQSTGPALPKITFIHRNSPLIQTAKETAVSKIVSKEVLTIPRQLCIGQSSTGAERVKPVRKGILILRGKPLDGITSSSTNNLLRPVSFSLGQLINTPQIQVSYSSPAPFPFPLMVSSGSGLSFSQSPRNAVATFATPVRIASKGSATCKDAGRSSSDPIVVDLSDVTTTTDNNATTSLPRNSNKDEIRGIPSFRQYYAIHCPFHADFNAYTKYLADEIISVEGDETSGNRQELGTHGFMSCPICSSYCVSMCGSTDELFDHMAVHKPWLQFVDVACHLCPMDKHLPTMQKLEFQGWCNWRNLRLSTLSDHLYTSHGVDSACEPNPHEQIYDVLLDPSKVRPSDSNSARFSSPLEFAKHMMCHFHVLSCRLVCSLCSRMNNGFGDVEGDGENDVARLEQHYRLLHPMHLDSIPIVFQLRVRPGQLKKPNRREIANKYQMVLSSVKSCFKPKFVNVATELRNETEFDESEEVGDDDVIPQIQCTFQSSGCEFRTSNVEHLTEHMDRHMADVPLRWRVSCHRCCSVFDNFLDAMLHLSRKQCSSVTVKVLAYCNDPATQLNGRSENIEDCFSKPLVDEVTIDALNCRSVSSDVLAQKFVDSFTSPETDSSRKPLNYHNVLTIEQMGLFLAVQAPVKSNIFSSKWTVIRDDDPSSQAKCQWQKLPSQVQMKKSVAQSSSAAFHTISVIPSKTGVTEDTQVLRNASETQGSEINSELPKVTVPSHVFNQLMGTKSTSSNIQNIKLLVNNLQPQLQKVVQSDQSTATKFKCGSKLKTQMLNKSLLLKNKTIHVESLQPKTVPIVDTSKNLNRSAYAEIETLFIGQQYGINENVKVIIKEIDANLQYQCPYCVYNSQSIFDVANHLVQEHDNADLELDDTNSIHLKTHTLLMHCRLCDYVTHHHASLLWHLQNIHDILDEPPMRNDDDPVEISVVAALESKRTPHFRCAKFEKCAFASVSVSAVVQHSYQSHAGDSNMFGISHVMCDKVSFGARHDNPSDIRMTSQFVCAHCHVVTSSQKLFATHYLYEHASRLLYICMYCEAHLNSLAAIIKHIDYRHAGFERLICSVMFIGDLGEGETATIQHKQSPNVTIDTAPPASGTVVSHHGLSSMFSVSSTDAKLASSNATESSEVHQSTSFLTNSHPEGALAADAGSCNSNYYASVKKIEGSRSCVVTYKGRELWLPYSIVAPLLKRP